MLQFASEDRMEELFIKYSEQAALAMPLSYTIRDEDEKLADLLQEFSQGLAETGSVIASKSLEISDKEQHLLKLAGLIQRRIDELLEGTFD